MPLLDERQRRVLADAGAKMLRLRGRERCRRCAAMARNTVITGTSQLQRAARKDDPQKRKPDITLAKTALGFEPSAALRQDLELTARWMKDVLPH
jgi:nucleoside-diphosphate-sugar epimerase